MKTTGMFIIGALAGTVAIAQDGPKTNNELMGHLDIDARIRYESVEQETLNSSDALTARARVGYQSNTVNGFDFFVELEGTQALDEDSFDAYPGAQGIAGHPVIADGNSFELNRAQVKYTNDEGFTTVLGRQRVILGNARFVGNVGWRQNEQTYDAGTIIYAPNSDLTFIAAYVDRVNRIFGSDAVAGAQRTLDTDAKVLNAILKASETAEYGVYYYGLGVDDVAAASSDTFGVYYTDSFEIDGGATLSSRLEYASQDDNSSSIPNLDYSNDYFHASLSAKQDAYSAGLGWEVLSGNGSTGFSTPLATLHAFNGWADVFLGTPAAGVEDLYAWVGYAFSPEVTGKLVYHSFDQEMGGIRYGSEWDAVLGYKLNDEMKVTAKYAFYNGTGGAPGGFKLDRTKVWLSLDYKF